jgi:hypothetical protein
MSAPSVIYFHSDGSGEDWAANNFTYRNATNTSSGPQTYRLYNADGNILGNGGNEITIDFQSSKYVCADAGSNAPLVLYVGNGSAPSSVPTTTSVDLVNASDYLYIFQSSSDVTRYSILDINGPVSGTTGTEGSSYSGTLTVNGTSLEYEIPATSSSGTYELKADDTTQLSIVHGSTASTGSAPNFDQTKIWTLISPMGDELDEIDLTGSGGSSTKKVFCNFW